MSNPFNIVVIALTLVTVGVMIGAKSAPEGRSRGSYITREAQGIKLSCAKRDCTEQVFYISHKSP